MPKPRKLGGFFIGLAAVAVAALSCYSFALQASSGMPPLEQLIAKEEIREKLALYTLLHDGDGISKDDEKWVRTLFTEDIKFQAVDTDGRLYFGPTNDGLVGRDTIRKTFIFGGGSLKPADPNQIQLQSRHHMINTVFDELTPTSAKTRTTAILMRGSKSTSTQGTPAFQLPLGVVIYHDTWRYESDGGWKKSKTVQYFSVCTATCTDSGHRLPNPPLHETPTSRP